MTDEVEGFSTTAASPKPPWLALVRRAVPVPFNGSVARLAIGFLSANRVRRWIREGG
ncbi:hypothetical protein [Spirillospora sp. CA-128828]|uniref:hypothetical protein n=1 Tax=Spirillospora sp. CA-128828 TaxID=3240033 RepID=UPI003D8AF7EE